MKWFLYIHCHLLSAFQDLIMSICSSAKGLKNYYNNFINPAH